MLGGTTFFQRCYDLEPESFRMALGTRVDFFGYLLVDVRISQDA